jgi:hypothetical protein
MYHLFLTIDNKCFVFTGFVQFSVQTGIIYLHSLNLTESVAPEPAGSSSYWQEPATGPYP